MWVNWSITIINATHVCVIEFHEYIVNDLSFVYRENFQRNKKLQ